MEFNILKKDFVSAISKVIGATEKKASMPILSNILIKIEKNILTIIGTDLEVTIITKIKCNIVSEGKTVVPAKKIFDFVKELPESEINIKIEDGLINMVIGKISGKLKVLQAEDFPMIEEYKDGFTKIDYNTIMKTIDKTIYAASTDEVRYSLNGIFLEKYINKLRFVATDSHRMALYDLEEVNSIEGLTKGVIIPRKGLYEMRKINSDNNVEIAIDKNKNFIVRIGDTTIQMRLLDYDFPDYKPVIPKETKVNIKINKNILASAIKRAQSIYQDKITRIIFNVNNKTLTIESNEPDTGEAKEEIEIDYNGEPLTIGFNGRYVLDCLNTIESDFIIIGLNNDQSVATIIPEEDKLHYNLIMPMRI